MVNNSTDVSYSFQNEERFCEEDQSIVKYFNEMKLEEKFAGLTYLDADGKNYPIWKEELNEIFRMRPKWSANTTYHEPKWYNKVEELTDQKCKECIMKTLSVHEIVRCCALDLDNTITFIEDCNKYQVFSREYDKFTNLIQNNITTNAYESIRNVVKCTSGFNEKMVPLLVFFALFDKIFSIKNDKSNMPTSLKLFKRHMIKFMFDFLENNTDAFKSFMEFFHLMILEAAKFSAEPLYFESND